MTKRKIDPILPPDEDYSDEDLEAMELQRQPSPLSANPLPDFVSGVPDMPETPTSEDSSDYDPDEVEQEMRIAFGDDIPTDEELIIQHAREQIYMLFADLPDFEDMPSWDRSFYQSQQSEKLEQLVESFTQAIQTIRTTTIHDFDSMLTFMIAVQGLCDSIPAKALAVCMVKHVSYMHRPQ